MVQFCARSAKETPRAFPVPKPSTKGVSTSTAKCWCSPPPAFLIFELVVVQNSLHLSQGDVKDERTERLDHIFEESEDTNTPPEPTTIRRAASYTDFYYVVRAQLTKDGQRRRKKKPDKKSRAWEALLLRGEDDADRNYSASEPLDQAFERQLLEESQQEYLYGSNYLEPPVHASDL